jgi:type I restriction enzyme, S subunit
MGKYQGYEKYKNSGVEWLGDIPEHWKNLKIKRLTQIKRGASPRPIDDPKYFDDEGEYAWVRIADVTASDRYLEETTQKLSDLGKSFSVPLEYGELFLSIAGSVGKPIITKIKCCIHDGFVYFPTLNANKEFLFYIFSSGQPYLGLGKMGTQLNLNTETVGGINIGLPPLEEQELIAHFLDRKTSQIDALIAKKEALLEKLDEKRTALISHAVTKGLAPNVPMKDSGVERLGETPKHWIVSRIKYYADCFNGSTPLTSNPDYWDDGEVPWLSSGKVNEEIVMEPSLYISRQALKECSLKIAPKGSVIVGIVGQGKTRGLSAYLGIDTTINQNMVAIAPCRKLEGKFLYLFVKQAYTSIRNLGRGANQPALDVGLIKRHVMLIPPNAEQKIIINYLDKKEREFYLATQKIQEAIALLKEYRTALITNAVTGKIDVRQVSSP